MFFFIVFFFFFFFILKSETCGNFEHEKFFVRVLWKMGFRNNAIQAGSLDVGKSKGRMQKDGAEKEIGCCVKFCFIGGCIPSRSKVDNSISGTSANSGNFHSLLICLSSLVRGNYFNLKLILGEN